MELKRVKLKAKSPDFIDSGKGPDTTVHRCDMPGCHGAGTHKAPKNRGLNEYYHFCYEHVQEYNRAWDFFSGMSAADVEQHLRDNMYGHRPTWRYTTPDMAEDLRRKAGQFRDPEGFAYEERVHERRTHANHAPQSAEVEALAIMGLEPPVTLQDIKTRYKTLAKKYHPDLNPEDPEAEELLKKINMSYTILKLAYEKYEKINKT